MRRYLCQGGLLDVSILPSSVPAAPVECSMGGKPDEYDAIKDDRLIADRARSEGSTAMAQPRSTEIKTSTFLTRASANIGGASASIFPSTAPIDKLESQQ